MMKTVLYLFSVNGEMCSALKTHLCINIGEKNGEKLSCCFDIK